MDRTGIDPLLSRTVSISRLVRVLLPVMLAAAPLAAQAPAPPAPDQGLAVDAEVRIALFDLLADRPVAALSRLRAVRAAPEMQVEGTAGGFGQPELQFLLAQSYARLGMGTAFRGTAQELLNRGETRYAPTLRLQLLLDAYRRGAYQEAVTLAGTAGTADRGLVGLVGGLAHYRTGSYAPARAAFDAAAASGGVYAGFARYMGALAQMAGDTGQSQAAMTALQGLAGDALGEFADQVNLTIAQLAYHRGDYDAAAAAAARVSAEGGMAAQATLTRAWALYKASQLDAAAQAFTDFATRYPQLPQRDEARLMVGQVRLQQGRVDDAGRHFQAIADSLAADVAMMRQGSAAAMSEAARAFVQARAASLLFLQEPAAGKSLAVPDNVGLDPASLAQALGSPAPATPVEQLRPELVSLADIAPRLDSLAPAAGASLTRRVVYLSDSGGTMRAEFARRTQALREADVAVALARYRLGEQLASHDSKLALIERLQAMLGEAAGRLDTMSVQLGVSRDSLIRLAAAAEEERIALRQLLQREADAVRGEAAENVRRTDSLRTSFRGLLSPEDSSLMTIERTTALKYQQLAENVLAGLDRAFERHPVMRMQDTIRRHIAESDALVLATRAAISATNDILGREIERMRATETERTRTARAAVASAESARAGAESAVLTAVEAELRARAATLLALVRRDAEAAEFGAASASFFKAVGTTAPATPGGAPGNASGPPGPSSPR